MTPEGRMISASVLRALFPTVFPRLPARFDYLGNDRGPSYVRGVTAVRCDRCGGTGLDPIKNDPTNRCGDINGNPEWPVCRACGAYGEVSPK